MSPVPRRRQPPDERRTLGLTLIGYKHTRREYVLKRSLACIAGTNARLLALAAGGNMPAFDRLDDLGHDESLDGSGGGTVGLILVCISDCHSRKTRLNLFGNLV